jgi:hypothetical protein
MDLIPNFEEVLIMSGKHLSIWAVLSPAMVCAWLFLSAACSNVELEEGSLVLDVSSPPGVKTLLPGTSMVPDSYDFHGAGPEGKTFDASSRTLPTTVKRLAYGYWKIAVNVKNDGANVIGMGEADVNVQTGLSQSVSIASKPVDGYGTLDLTVLWPAADVVSPGLAGTVTPWNGSPIVLAFELDPLAAGKATVKKQYVPTGYHTLSVKLLDGGTAVMGAVETVRIVKDGVTAGTFEFQKVNKPGGSVAIDVTQLTADPLTVSMSGQAAELQVGQTMTVRGAVSGYAGACVYRWYLNGEQVSTTQAYTVGAGLTAGQYRLDLVAVSSDGTRSGSCSHLFAVEDPAQVTLEWDPNAEPDISGYRLHYGPSSGNYRASVDVGAVTAYTITGLDRNATYYIAATAYNAAGSESAYSNEVVFASN